MVLTDENCVALGTAAMLCAPHPSTGPGACSCAIPIGHHPVNLRDARRTQQVPHTRKSCGRIRREIDVFESQPSDTTLGGEVLVDAVRARAPGYACVSNSSNSQRGGAHPVDAIICRARPPSRRGRWCATRSSRRTFRTPTSKRSLVASALRPSVSGRTQRRPRLPSGQKVLCCGPPTHAIPR